MESRSCEWTDLIAPRVPKLGEAMEENHLKCERGGSFETDLINTVATMMSAYNF